MDALTNKLNAVLSDWKLLFDPTSQTQLAFQLNETSQLCFNGKPLCPAHNMELFQAQFNIDQIRFDFAEQCSIKITIRWPEDAVPYAAEICLLYALDTRVYDQA